MKRINLACFLWWILPLEPWAGGLMKRREVWVSGEKALGYLLVRGKTAPMISLALWRKGWNAFHSPNLSDSVQVIP